MDTIWLDDFEPAPGRKPLPGIVQAWLKRETAAGRLRPLGWAVVLPSSPLWF